MQKCGLALTLDEMSPTLRADTARGWFAERLEIRTPPVWASSTPDFVLIFTRRIADQY